MTHHDRRLSDWLCAKYGIRVMRHSLNVWALGRAMAGTPEAQGCAS